MIHTLFPDEVVTVEASAPMWRSEVYPEEKPYVARAVEKRQQEYAAGRRCCRQGLATLGITDFPIIPAASRAPIWPPGITGSISHCEGYCGVAITRTGEINGLGFDAEPTTHKAPETDLIDLICTRTEKKWLAAAASQDRSYWFKLFFSAKESVYKAIYPSTSIDFNFLDIEIMFHPENLSFEVSPAHWINLKLPAISILECRYESNSKHVFTGAVLKTF